MTRTIKHSIAILAAMTLTGCGSCQSGTTTAPSAPAPPAPAQKAAPPQPPAAAAPQQPAAPPAQQPAAAPATPEVDCFVLVDAEPDFGPPPMKVQFETDIECTGSPVTFSWDFGDGSSGGSEANPVHVYTKAGEYVAVVKVKAPDGGEGEDEIDITVDEDLEADE
jgi:hypothetical protein